MNSTEMMAKALREVGDNGRDAVFQIALPQSTTSGTWPLSFVGQQTAPLAAFGTALQVQAALEALPNIGTGNVMVRGIPLGPFTIRFVCALGGQPLPSATYPLTADGSSLNPAAFLVVLQPEVGEEPVLGEVVQELYDNVISILDERLRFLTLKRDLIDVLLGESQKGIDVQIAQRIEKYSQQHLGLLKMRQDVQTEINQLLTQGVASVAGTSAGTSVGKICRQTPNGRPFGVLRYNWETGRYQ